jgi:DeoR/GlpR family transcriptional regulator of sugar metabolism
VALADRGKTTEHGAEGGVSSLSPSQRRERIAEYVLRHDAVTAKELATVFDVSIMTVHRDLDELERQGVIRKYRGGVTPQPSSLFESNVRFRHATATAEKAAIARYALTLVEPGQAVMLDDSTTTLALARLLPAVSPVTVITNFLATIKELAGKPGIRLLALGGEYIERHDAFLGLVCETAIANLRADVFFLSTAAVAHGEAYHQEQEIVAVKRAMLNVSTRKILLVDHNKLGKVALHRLAPLREFDLVIVDDGAREDDIRALREARVAVAVAPMRETATQEGMGEQS